VFEAIVDSAVAEVASACRLFCRIVASWVACRATRHGLVVGGVGWVDAVVELES
jgi:hypothetical protein